MTRTQILFDPELLQRARLRARELGVSLGAYVRDVVAEDLGGSAPTTDPGVVFDLGASAGGDVARDKDAMLGQALSGSSG